MTGPARPAPAPPASGRPAPASPASGRGAPGLPVPARAALLALAGAAVLLASACATLGMAGGGTEDRFHRLWEEGRYRQAVAVFERDSTALAREGGPGARVLWRLALARLQPAEDGSGFRDARGAARALERLLAAEPEGERAVEARTLLELIRTLGTVRTQLERLKAIDLGEPPGGGGG